MFSKTISMSLGPMIATATITPDMHSEEEIYHSLRSAFTPFIDAPLHIAIYYPTSAEKIALKFPAFRKGITYRIELVPARIQGSGSASAGTMKTRHNVDEMMKNWGLDDASEILPQHIAPPGEPAGWSKRLSEELRGLSARSKGRREVAVWFLEEEVRGRVERDGDGEGVMEVRGGDVKRAVKRMLGYMASEAGEMELFAGGEMKEALEEVEVEREVGDEGGVDEGEVVASGQWTMELTSHFKK